MSAPSSQAGAVAWRELRTQADIDAAVAAGDRIEYTAFKEDSIDLPSSDQFGSGGWILLYDPRLKHTIDGRLRALDRPPAAVPVEALEGLVDKLRNSHISRHAIADELTTIIKERSNG